MTFIEIKSPLVKLFNATRYNLSQQERSEFVIREYFIKQLEKKTGKPWLDWVQENSIEGDKKNEDQIKAIIWTCLENTNEDFNNPHSKDQITKCVGSLPDNLDLGLIYESLFKITKSTIEYEFFTPPRAVKLMEAFIDLKETDTLYDPTCGSGNMFVNSTTTPASYYGQEFWRHTTRWCLLNLVLKGIPLRKINLGTGDLFKVNPFEGLQFDKILANPPFSLKFWEIDGNTYNKSDYDLVYLRICLERLKDSGKGSILLPSSVLTNRTMRGTRKELFESNVIDSLVQLPSDLFLNTKVSTVLINFRKNRGEKETISLYDFSKGFDENDIPNLVNNHYREVSKEILFKGNEGYEVNIPLIFYKLSTT